MLKKLEVEGLSEKEREVYCSFIQSGQESLALKYLKELAALKHIDANLERVANKSFVSYPYGRNRGYSTGTIVFRRKDDSPITEVDIEALKLRQFGQISNVIGKAGELMVKVNFTCDSTG